MDKEWSDTFQIHQHLIQSSNIDLLQTIMHAQAVEHNRLIQTRAHTRYRDAGTVLLQRRYKPDTDEYADCISSVVTVVNRTVALNLRYRLVVTVWYGL